MEATELTVEWAEDLYRKTGVDPGSGHYYLHGCACIAGVMAIAIGLDIHPDMKECPNDLVSEAYDIPADKVALMTLGFDRGREEVGDAGGYSGSVTEETRKDPYFNAAYEIGKGL